MKHDVKRFHHLKLFRDVPQFEIPPKSIQPSVTSINIELFPQPPALAFLLLFPGINGLSF
jgi:hypothetical protein